MEKKPTKIKLLIATGLYPPEIGGPATYAKMLEETLQAHHIEVTVLAFGTVRHLPKVVRHVAFALKLFKAAKDKDVVYALDPISVGLPAWFVSVLRRKYFMVRLGGDYAWEQGQQRFGLKEDLDTYTANKKKASLPVRVLAVLQSFVVGRAKRVVVPSEYLKSIVATWGVKESRLRVIYSALFPLTVTESKEALRDQLAYDGVTITSVGRLVPWKGFDVLIGVVASLVEEGRDISLVIAGDGPMMLSLKEKAKNLGVEKNVRFVGRLSKDALGATIKASDIFVLNTSYEGLSHQLLEVMDIGVPIITTDVGGNPELIKDGVSGILVGFNDADAIKSSVERFIKNTDLQTRLVQNARVRTQDFRQDIVVQQFVDELRSLLEE